MRSRMREIAGTLLLCAAVAFTAVTLQGQRAPLGTADLPPTGNVESDIAFASPPADWQGDETDSSSPAFVARPLEAGVLDLKVGAVYTAALPDLREADAEPLAVGAYHVVQLDGPMTPERKARLDAVGLVLGDYLPNFAYVVKLDGVDLAALAQLEFVRWLGAFASAWKIDPEIGLRTFQTPRRQELQSDGLLQVVIVLFDRADNTETLATLNALGAQVLAATPVPTPAGTQWMIDAIVGPIDVNVLAELNEVQWIEDAPEGTLRNNTNRWILQSNTSNVTPVWNAGIHGENQVAGLIDGTPRESHCDFDDSVSPGTPSHRKFIGWRNAGGTDSHGTHTAGTLAGDYGTYGSPDTYDGMALAAKISFSNVDNVFSSPSTLVTRLNDAYADGGRNHSNSWGDDGTTAYTTWCRQIDLHSYNNEESMVAFAVTNLSTLKTPENAKSVLAVGASQDTPNQANHCSGGAGPTADGRRKPEIYAPGCSTNSANSATTCGTTQFTGTSMACPAITGAAVLARQYYTDGYYPTGAATPGDELTPSGALIRATLINAAVDMTGISGYPSNTEGWGRLLLDNALYFPGNTSKLYVEDVRNSVGLSTGQQTQYQFTVNSNAVPLRVTLAFTEPAAAVNASNPTINNIDLEVLAPGSTLYRGNVFSGGQSTTGGTADAKNTVEQVHRTSPATGDYTVTIKGTAVNTGLQGYALVVTGDISTSSCAAPAITGDPASLTRCEGAAAAFSVTATGSAPLSYQWRKDGGDIGGATSSTYSIPAVSAGDAGDYDCVVTNSCGNATSAAATLTVNTAPQIISGPADASGCVGDSAAFSVSATGSAPFSYQWRKDGADIGGATGSTYTIASLSLGDAGDYDCVVTNGCGSQTSSAAALTVIAGDLDGDGTIGLADLSNLLTNFGMTSGATYADGDLDGDGDVDLADLSDLLTNFGLSC